MTFIILDVISHRIYYSISEGPIFCFEGEHEYLSIN